MPKVVSEDWGFIFREGSGLRKDDVDYSFEFTDIEYRDPALLRGDHRFCDELAHTTSLLSYPIQHILHSVLISKQVYCLGRPAPSGHPRAEQPAGFRNPEPSTRSL